MRHVPQGTTWHDATDALRGTDVYGDKDDDSNPFSVKWDTEDYNQVGKILLHVFHFSTLSSYSPLGTTRPG